MSAAVDQKPSEKTPDSKTPAPDVKGVGTAASSIPKDTKEDAKTVPPPPARDPLTPAEDEAIGKVALALHDKLCELQHETGAITMVLAYDEVSTPIANALMTCCNEIYTISSGRSYDVRDVVIAKPGAEEINIPTDLVTADLLCLEQKVREHLHTIHSKKQLLNRLDERKPMDWGACPAVFAAIGGPPASSAPTCVDFCVVLAVFADIKTAAKALHGRSVELFVKQATTVANDAEEKRKGFEEDLKRSREQYIVVTKEVARLEKEIGGETLRVYDQLREAENQVKACAFNAYATSKVSQLYTRRAKKTTVGAAIGAAVARQLSMQLSENKANKDIAARTLFIAGVAPRCFHPKTMRAAAQTSSLFSAEDVVDDASIQQKAKTIAERLCAATQSGHDDLANIDNGFNLIAYDIETFDASTSRFKLTMMRWTLGIPRLHAGTSKSPSAKKKPVDGASLQKKIDAVKFVLDASVDSFVLRQHFDDVLKTVLQRKKATDEAFAKRQREKQTQPDAFNASHTDDRASATLKSATLSANAP